MLWHVAIPHRYSYRYRYSTYGVVLFVRYKRAMKILSDSLYAALSLLSHDIFISLNGLMVLPPCLSERYEGYLS